MFLSAFWTGETAMISIDDHIYWMDSHNWEDYENINICQLSFENIKSLFWSTPVSFTIPHVESTFKMTISTNMSLIFNYRFETA